MQLHSSQSPSTFAETVSDKFDIISNLLNNDLNQQLKNLTDNAQNLERVAQYCEDIYVDSNEADKSKYLKETKGFTNQALASISYQIFLIANSYLKLFETQFQTLTDSANQISLIAQEVNVHKEKVARREIGFITSNKTQLMHPDCKMERTSAEEPPAKYTRSPIDFCSLDHIGHGHGLQVEEEEELPQVTDDFLPTPPLVLRSSALLASLNASSGRDTIRSTNSNNSSYYYNRPSVSVILPPSVPSEYLSRQELGIYSSKKELNLNQSSSSDQTQTNLDFRRFSQNSAFGAILKPNEYSSSYVALN
jgi:hypothetical protein